MVDYGQFFEEGKVFVDGLFYGDAIELFSLGELQVTSGAIVASDPLVCPDYQPFERRIEPGNYPVISSIIDGRNAFTMLRLADRPAVRWEMATLEGEDASELSEGQYIGYPVDAGTGCFMDVEASEAMLAQMDEQGYEYSEGFIDELYGGSGPIPWYAYAPSADSEANVIMFSSGYGDGVYGSYWGYNEAGEVVALVTDFNVVDLSDPETRLGDESELT